MTFWSIRLGLLTNDTDMMKYKTTLYTILAVMLVSCSSMESDAERMAELQCESMRMVMDNTLGAIENGDIDTKSIEEHGEKVQKFAEKMMEKYQSSEEMQKFQALVVKKSMEICRE